MLSGRVVLITGGTDGIGRATAISATARGARVLVGGRRREQGAETVALAGSKEGQCAFHPLDVTDRASIRAFIAEGVKRYGRVDSFVNNAGFSGTRAIMHLRSDDEDEQVFAINLWGLYHCMKDELPVLLDGGGGTIVNTASVGAHIAIPGLSSYIASKHGVLGLTKAAAVEYASHNIRVNCVCPSGVPTAMAATLAVAAPEVQGPISKAHPLGRGRPEEIADAILYLASDRSSYVTGQCLTVDGGLTATSALPWNGAAELGLPIARRLSPACL